MLVWQFGYVPYWLDNAVIKGNFRTRDFQEEKQRVMLNMSSQYLGALAGTSPMGALIDKSGNPQESLEARQLLSKFLGSDFGAILQNSLNQNIQEKEEATSISYGDMSVMSNEEIQKIASQDLQFVSKLTEDGQRALDYLAHFFEVAETNKYNLIVDDLYNGMITNQFVQDAIAGNAMITEDQFAKMQAGKRQVLESYMQLKRQITALQSAGSSDVVVALAQSFSKTMKQAKARCDILADRLAVKNAVSQVKEDMIDVTKRKDLNTWVTTDAVTIRTSSMDQGLKKELENASKAFSFSAEEKGVYLMASVGRVGMTIAYTFNAKKQNPKKPNTQKFIAEQKTNLGAILNNLIAKSIVSKAYVTALAGVHEGRYSIDPTPYQAWNSMVDLGVSLSFMDYLRSVANGPVAFFIINKRVFPAKQLLEAVTFGNALSYEGGKQRAKFYKMSEWKEETSKAPNTTDALARSAQAVSSMEQGFAATLMTVKMNIAANGV